MRIPKGIQVGNEWLEHAGRDTNFATERLVHGPLTALMLLDTTAFHYPEVKPKAFEYRALNPLVVNKGITIHGAWDRASAGDSSRKALLVWAVDDENVVGMSGRITV